MDMVVYPLINWPQLVYGTLRWGKKNAFIINDLSSSYGHTATALSVPKSLLSDGQSIREMAPNGPQAGVVT